MPGAVKIVNYGIKPVDVDGDYVRWAWKVELENEGTDGLTGVISVQLLDDDGFVLDDAADRFALGPGETGSFTGNYPTKKHLWDQVKKYNFRVG